MHIPIERPDAPTQVAEAVEVEPTDLEPEANLDEDMVTCRTFSINRFLPDTRPAGQPQQPPTQDRTPPPPSVHTKKKQRVGDPPSRIPSDVPSKTPYWLSSGIVIWEPTGAPHPMA